MARTYQVLIRMLGDASQARGAITGLANTMDARGKQMQKTGAMLSKRLTLPILALGAVGLKAAVDFDSSQRQMAAALKSSGNAAGLSQKKMTALAAAIEAKTGIDELQIQRTQTLLASMGGLSSQTKGAAQVMDRATRAATDLGVRLKNPETAARAVAKAMNDPISGMTALQKAGVRLTDSQKKQVKAMAAAGDQAGAQNVILGALEKKVGGAANAYGKTLPGQIARTSDSFEDLLRDALKPALPEIRKVLESAAKLAQKFSDATPRTKKAAVAIAAVAAAAGPATWAVGGLMRACAGLLRAAGWTITAAARIVAQYRLIKWNAAAAGMSVRSYALTQAKAMASAAASAVKATAKIVAQLVVQAARWAWMGVQALLSAAKVAAAWLIALGPIGLVIAAVAVAAVLIVKHWDAIKAKAVQIWNAIKAKTAAAWAAIKQKVANGANAVKAFIKRWGPLILATLAGPLGLMVLAVVKNWTKIKNAVRDGAQAALRWVKEKFGAAQDFITGLPGRLGSLVTKLGDLGKRAGTALANALKGALNAILDKIRNLRIPSFPGASKIPGVRDLVGTQPFGSLPHLASGALLYGDTLFRGGEYPGARTNPEVVAPLSDLRGMLGRGSGGGGGVSIGKVEVHVSGPVDPWRVARRMRQEIQSQIGALAVGV